MSAFDARAINSLCIADRGAVKKPHKSREPYSGEALIGELNATKHAGLYNVEA